MQNVIIVGSGHVAQLLAEKIEKHPEYGLHVVGFVDRDDPSSTTNGKPLIGTTEDLPRLVEELVSSVSSSPSRPSRTSERSQVIRSLQDCEVQIDIVPRMFEVLGTNAQLHTVEGVPLVGLPSPHAVGIFSSSQAVVRSRRCDARPRPPLSDVSSPWRS